MVDKTLVMRKLSELEEYLNQIREFSSISPEEYSANWKTQRIVERTLQMMIELCVDIAGHLISERRLRVPTGYADAFRVLSKGNVIDSDLSERMEKMAGFRNVLVHNYDRIDERIVVAILKQHLDDFLVFRDAILKVLKKES